MAKEEKDEARENQAGGAEVIADDFAGSTMMDDRDSRQDNRPVAESTPENEHRDNANNEGAPPTDSDGDKNRAFAIDYGALPVDLRFEIARQSSSVEELSQLNVGSVIDLDKTPESLVAIYANGRRVATAELVMVDGKVGARIKSRD